MQAQNRAISTWYSKINQHEIVLPRFQRPTVWEYPKICSLMNTIINNLPSGITLLLQVGDKEQFHSRPIKTAPSKGEKVSEQLLDGQQRLTAIWRTLHDNYENASFYISVPGLSIGEPGDEYEFVKESRWSNKNGDMRPIWCDEPSGCLRRDYVPSCLFAPVDVGDAIERWLEEAMSSWPRSTQEELEAYYQAKDRIKGWIIARRETIAHYNLPYLALPSSTPKHVALDVFINMNTNGKPLSQFDIIVAQIEDELGESLVAKLSSLNSEHPKVARYGNLSDIVLSTASLLQGKQPNQKGAWESDKNLMVEQWEQIANGLGQMAELLEGEGIYDAQRLPTNAVLPVVAALYVDVPHDVDKVGVVNTLLKRYLWRSFFTDRYEKAAATRAFQDYKELQKHFTKLFEGSPSEPCNVPALNNELHPLPSADELKIAAWPKNRTTLGRAILALATREGARDFATGKTLSVDNIGNRHYHHVFSDALLESAGLEHGARFRALNCALIEGTTNQNIGKKAPLDYLKDRYKWATKEVVSERLGSHIIPVGELENGGYEGLSHDEQVVKICKDYNSYLDERAKLVVVKMKEVCSELDAPVDKEIGD